MALLRRVTIAAAAKLTAPRCNPQHMTAVRWASNLQKRKAAEAAAAAAAAAARSRPRTQGQNRTPIYNMLTVAVVGGLGYYGYSLAQEKVEEKRQQGTTVVIPKAELLFEQNRTTTTDTVTATTKSQLSPQHQQVKSSLENPGVYAWGSNAGRVVAPDSDEPVIKDPRRIAAFDGQLLRDLCLDRDVGVAVTEKGDVVQWGAAFWGKEALKGFLANKKQQQVPPPVPTLTGKDIVKVTLSKDRIIALGSNGTVYSLPISQIDQHQTQAASSPSDSSSSSSSSSSSWSLWAGNNGPKGPVQYRNITPSGLSWGEHVVDVSSGLEHCLLLTSKGRVFSAVSTFYSYPTKGQMGVPGLTWQTRPKGPIDQPIEVPGLQGISVQQIATGDSHSVVLDKNARIFAFGDNAAGQLGIAPSPTFSLSENPVQVAVEKLYDTSGGNAIVTSTTKTTPPKVTSIAAGGANTFFTVDALVGEEGRPKQPVADTWACGSGICGSLGTGKWSHLTLHGPVKVKALSGLSEYSEKAGKTVPIQLASLAVESTHASAVLDNATRLTADDKGGRATDVNWGADVLWWGGNEHFQLGTGKRSNLCEPAHIAPLDRDPTADRSRDLNETRERLGITPRTTARLGPDGKGRKATVEQKVVCGRFVSGVFSST